LLENKQDIGNIRLFRKKYPINIGVILFGAIFIYLLVAILMYLTTSRVTSYEVREGSIFKDNAYTGIALRKELIVNSEGSGYINYYTTARSKVGIGNNVYSVSPEKIEPIELGETNTSEEQKNSLSNDEYNTILVNIQNFSENFKEEDFDSVYQMNEQIASVIQNAANEDKTALVTQLVNEGKITGLSLYQAPDDGIIEYYIDGYESRTADTITEQDFDKTNYKKQEFGNNKEAVVGEPAYKIITDETWHVVINLNPGTAESILAKQAEKERDFTNIQVRFLKDGETVWGSLTIEKKNDFYIGTIEFSNSLVRYASERYLDIELILENKTGLKIPKSSKVKKDFFIAPKEYVTAGGNSSSNGVLVRSERDGETITEFKHAEIYYEDIENGIVYLDPNVFEENMVLVKPESNETFRLSTMRSLEGVYNINKGYAIFKQIEILSESDEYYIVKTGNSYSLSNYDHIALEGSKLKENDVVVQ